jgi:hypothetical protein
MSTIGEQIREIIRSTTSEIQKAGGQRNDVIFKVVPISNGFLVAFPDTEEYKVKGPVFRHLAPSQRPVLHPEMEEKRRWRIVMREVYCADGDAIKLQIEEALKIVEKVKFMKAQAELTGETEDEGDLYAPPSVVGAYRAGV